MALMSLLEGRRSFAGPRRSVDADSYANGRILPRPPSSPLGNRKQEGQQKRVELDQEVEKLRKILDHEEKVHKVLQDAFRHEPGNHFPLPRFLPPQVKQLLDELTMVEEEIIRLETELNTLRQDLHQGNRNLTKFKSQEFQPQHQQQEQQRPKSQGGHSRHGSLDCSTEIRTMLFISRAINGSCVIPARNSKTEVPKKTQTLRDTKKANVHKSLQSKLPPRYPKI
ncbi:hypothetical protein AMTRI_Chr07g29370 [Amborella trichopoda]